jgi:predicted neuraminidase
MGDWRVVADEEGRTEWERRDRFVRVIVRRTATGEWATTLDALEQAPEGPAYARETHATREAASDRARAWREAYAME